MNTKNKRKKHKAKPNNSPKEIKRIRWSSKKPVISIILKSIVIILPLFLLIRFIDSKGYFNSDESNNHTRRKWDSFYKFTKRNNVDVLLIGNSHLYTGVNPKNLSVALGANAFILASPGANITDSYFTLKEAMKRSDVKLVVLETYGITDFNPKVQNKDALSYQFQRFEARKDLLTKLTSTPVLFNPENYFYAWSSMLRNHEFMFKDKKQLSINKKIIEQKKKDSRLKNNKKLYLGRYVRFQKGIEPEIINKYDSLGPPVCGKSYRYSSHAEKYLDKIVKVCRDNKVELMFLTLPMYERHIKNYEKWEEKLSGLLGKYPYEWLNMQKNPWYSGFDKYAFESTYLANQHMTYSGSLLATYKLTEFIRDSLKIELTDRTKQSMWHSIFYGEEGYFYNFNPKAEDRMNVTLCSDRAFGNLKIKKCLFIGATDKEANKLIVKVDKQNLVGVPLSKIYLGLIVKVLHEGQEIVATVKLDYDKFHRPEKDVIFTTYLKPIKILEVVNAGFMSK